jgi:mannose-6-phosphate isomerase-like protein (cupin superfamily)
VIYPFRPETEFEIEERCFIVEMLSVRDDPACSIARARVKPGVATALHSVTGTVERYIILQGEGEVRIGQAPPQRVKAMDVVLIPANLPQSIRNVSPAEDLLFLCICTPGFRMEAFVNLERA